MEGNGGRATEGGPRMDGNEGGARVGAGGAEVWEWWLVGWLGEESIAESAGFLDGNCGAAPGAVLANSRHSAPAARG